MCIINLLPQPVPHLLPLFNELPLVALNKISTLRKFQQQRTDKGRREQPEWVMEDGERERGGNRDIPAGPGTPLDLHGQMNHNRPGALGSLGHEQGTNNYIRAGC